MTNAPEPVLLQDLTDGVLLLTLNRPERNNGWNIDLEEAYFDALFDAAKNPDVRAIVTAGAGRSFCPGMDMQVLERSTEGVRVTKNARRPMTFARRIPKPIVVAVNGACAGIGLIQACSADIRFASTAAKFTTSFARRGLPAENSLSWILPRIVGTGVAMDLLLSGRVILAEEALQLGLVNRLYEPDELVPAALAYAKDMAANCSPRAMAAIKQQVQEDWEGTSEASRKEAMRLVQVLRDETPDFKEGVASFTEKRPANFEGLSVEVNVELDAAF
ncbi:MAG: enoyl-CoA hydratase [Acidimicrobiia bacterium]|nr:enoyl-CoA hydratase [Acidimicrobiia bacterium]